MAKALYHRRLTRDEATNYRGISLILILAKIYSKLLINRLKSWAEKRENLSKKQFGFQKGKSLTNCIFVLNSIIMKVLSSNN